MYKSTIDLASLSTIDMLITITATDSVMQILGEGVACFTTGLISGQINLKH